MLKCIAIDDEPLALELLENFISRVPFLHLIKKCNNGFDAMEILQQENIDIMFLDIQMPDITGLQLLKALARKPKVIFTTAYSNYALEGFEVDAVDYLLKPFAFERFLKAVNKARQQLSAINTANQEEIKTEKSYTFIKSGYDTVKVTFKDILYIEGAKDYVIIHTNERKVMTLMSMKAILDLLPVNHFTRIHRSYIIALDKIDIIQKQDVIIKNRELPIGETYRKDFFALIESNV